MTETRFDIAFAVSTVSQFANNLSPEHVSAVNRIFRYLKKYSSLGIMSTKNKPLLLHGYVDSDFAMDPITRRSTTGFLFTLAGGVVSASSKRQHSVSLSSIEAEYVFCCQATKGAVWLRLLLKKLGHPQPGPTSIFCDNNIAILLANNPEFYSRTKHIDTQVHLIREITKTGKVILEWIFETKRIADVLTKPLDRILYQSFVTGAKMKYG